jgi:hypothetical protein
MTARRRVLARAAGVLAIAQALAFAAHATAASMPKARVGSAVPSSSVAAPSQSTQGAPTVAPPANATVLLSNERTLTTWANPVEEVPIRAHPDRGSRTVARTHLETEDGFPEVYVVLARTQDARGRVWVRMRIPGRPNGRIGWVRQSALGEFHVTHWLIEIRLGARRLTAYYNGELRFSAPVGVGKPSTPTPIGHFWIRERLKLSDPSNPYWPYALGTSAYSSLTEWPGGGVVGIHGPLGAPQLIPGDPSHGCVRMHDAAIAWLAPRVQLGTPVHILR